MKAKFVKYPPFFGLPTLKNQCMWCSGNLEKFLKFLSKYGYWESPKNTSFKNFYFLKIFSFLAIYKFEATYLNHV
jgi:hypothetical protein